MKRERSSPALDMNWRGQLEANKEHFCHCETKTSTLAEIMQESKDLVDEETPNGWFTRSVC